MNFKLDKNPRTRSFQIALLIWVALGVVEAVVATVALMVLL